MPVSLATVYTHTHTDSLIEKIKVINKKDSFENHVKNMVFKAIFLLS